MDGVPYWDGGAPNLHRLGDWRARNAEPFNDHEPVDSSAAAIGVQGLLRLGRYLDETTADGKKYWQAGLTAMRQFEAVARHYQPRRPRMPRREEGHADVERMELDIGGEAVLEVANGLLPDVRLEAPRHGSARAAAVQAAFAILIKSYPALTPSLTTKRDASIAGQSKVNAN